MSNAQQVPRDGRLGVELSNTIVHILSRHTGHPVAKIRQDTDDLIAVIMEDTLTRGEQTLVANGQSELVLATRREYQSAMRAELIDAVEGLTGRSVRAFLSENHLEPELAVEVFVLTPAEG